LGLEQKTNRESGRGTGKERERERKGEKYLKVFLASV